MDRRCAICNRVINNNIAKYCDFGCKKLVKRAKANERNQRLNAIKASLKDNQFHCYYTGIPLEIQDSSSPFYFTFDHVNPGDSEKIVACAAFVNDMKSDSNEKEFKNNTIILAKHFLKKRINLNRSDFTLKHFKRNK